MTPFNLNPPAGRDFYEDTKKGRKEADENRLRQAHVDLLKAIESARYAGNTQILYHLEMLLPIVPFRLCPSCKDREDRRLHCQQCNQDGFIPREKRMKRLQVTKESFDVATFNLLGESKLEDCQRAGLSREDICIEVAKNYLISEHLMQPTYFEDLSIVMEIASDSFSGMKVRWAENEN